MGLKRKNKFLFFALAPTGIGLSGSDRIFIELAREWSKRHSVTIFTTREGNEMMRRQNLQGKFLKTEIVAQKLPSMSFLRYLYKIILGIKVGLTLPKSYILKPITYTYSSSDFWMDVFPAVILKIRFNSLKWIATWYQTAPNPIGGFREGKRKRGYNLSAFFYWLSQLPVRPLIRSFADKVIVNNFGERRQFPTKYKEGNVVVLIGAVRREEIENWKLKIGNLPKVYDAVFQGRFHPQKGVVELINIWRRVVDKRPDAKLAMIGDGPLMKEVKMEIGKLKLEKNVKLFGYVFDGPKKYKIFSKSKIVVHPAFYDSGGMASAEAMAFGLPAVGFSLKAYSSYYPHGMVKVKTGDLEAFTDAICDLLANTSLRREIGTNAYEMIKKSWSWEKRSSEILKQIV